MDMKLRAEIGTAILLLGWLVSASALSAQQIDCPIQKSSSDPAVSSFRQGDFSKAFELYFSAARNNPNDLQAIAGQIRTLLQEGQISEASQLAESSLDESRQPGSAHLHGGDPSSPGKVVGCGGCLSNFSEA
jgi:hypothetical protein